MIIYSSRWTGIVSDEEIRHKHSKQLSRLSRAVEGGAASAAEFTRAMTYIGKGRMKPPVRLKDGSDE